MAFLRFILIVAGLVLAFTWRPFLYIVIGGAIVFLFTKTREDKDASRTDEKDKHSEPPPQ